MIKIDPNRLHLLEQASSAAMGAAAKADAALSELIRARSRIRDPDPGGAG